MEGIVILSVLTLCIFAPMVVFGIIGYRAINELGKRPSQGGKVMVPMILKLAITSAILIGLLMMVLEVFG